MTAHYPIPPAALVAFRAAWHAADDEGDAGNRVERGLTAAAPYLPRTRVIELTGPEHLISHIEGLQATLTKRNATIASLEEALALARGESIVEPSHPALREAYRKGYDACRSRVGEAQREAARIASELSASLGRSNVDAYFARDLPVAEAGDA